MAENMSLILSVTEEKFSSLEKTLDKLQSLVSTYKVCCIEEGVKSADIAKSTHSADIAKSTHSADTVKSTGYKTATKEYMTSAIKAKYAESAACSVNVGSTLVSSVGSVNKGDSISVNKGDSIRAKYENLLEDLEVVELTNRLRDVTGLEEKGQTIRFLSVEGEEEEEEFLSCCGSTEELCVEELCMEGLDEFNLRLLSLATRVLQASPEQCAAAREELKVAICSLQDMCKEHLAAKVVDTFVDISGPVMELQAAALSPLGSVEKAEKFKVKASEFSLHAEQLCRVAEVATDVGCDEDPNRHDAIKISIEGVRDATPMVVLSAKTLSLNPKSESAKENFELVKQQWVAEASQLRSDVDKCVTPADFLVESERKCREEGQMAIVLMKTSPKEAVVKVSMVQKITNRVLEVTDAELENLGPGEYKNKLQADRVGLENAIKAAGDATNDHITGKTKDLNQFNKSVTEVHMNISRIREDMVGFYLPLPPLPEDLPPPIDDDTPPARPPGPAESDEEDDDFDVDAPAPDPVEAPIEHAAFKLRQETAKYYEDENDMITAARKIAQKFQQMAKYTKGRREILELGSTEEKSEFSSMTDMIKTCREVIALTKTIQKHANAISSNCPDKRLVMSLSNSMEPMGMLSQQLNIISSVKAAASGRYDESAEVEADEMLTINAQNLMKSVRDTVRASESCSVKIMSQAGNLQFKRKK